MQTNANEGDEINVIWKKKSVRIEREGEKREKRRELEKRHTNNNLHFVLAFDNFSLV